MYLRIRGSALCGPTRWGCGVGVLIDLTVQIVNCEKGEGLHARSI